MLDVKLRAFGRCLPLHLGGASTIRIPQTRPFGDDCRIPTLKEVFELHKKYASLMHLTSRSPTSTPRSKMLDDHGHVGSDFQRQRIQSKTYAKIRSFIPVPTRPDCMKIIRVFPEAIAAALAKPGSDVICDDPRGGREWHWDAS